MIQVEAKDPQGNNDTLYDFRDNGYRARYFGVCLCIKKSS